MATSNNFDTSNQYIKYRIVVTENSYSIPNNNSSVSVQVQVWRTNTGYTTYGSGTCYCTINGTEYSQSITANQEFTYNSYTPVFSTTVTIPHDADGSKTIYVSSRITHDRFSSSSQGFNVTLTKIPRYATSNQTLANKTETTIKMNWSSDSTIDYIWYSSNNGSSWTGIDVTDGTSGSYTINNLSANTTYNIKTRVRRKDSQLTTDSAALSVTTYDYPKCNSAPNFIIGNKVTLGFYNPLGRTFDFYIIVNNTQISNHWTINGTSYTGIDGTTTQDMLYATIPNTKSATYQVKVIYGNITKTFTGGTCSINENNCKPTIGNITYVDNNATTTAITGNNQLIIRNNSNLVYTFGTLSAIKSATLSKVEVTINGVTKNQSLSGSSASNTQINFGTINVSSNTTATIKLTDSRQVVTTTTANISVLDWVLPTAILTLQRQNNYYSTTYIKANASYSSLNGNNTITLQYQYKKTTDSSYSSLATLTNNVQSQFEADNLYQWNVRVIVTDRLGSTTYNLFLDKGMPIVFFDRYNNSTGFNKFPTQNNSTESDKFVGNLIGTATNATKWNNVEYAMSTENTTDTWVPVLNNGKFEHRVINSALNKKGVKTLTGVDGLGWSNQADGDSYLISKAFMAWWNGSYQSGSNHSSNLTYAHQGTIQCKPTNLYNNTSGTNGTVTLSQTSANFTYLVIFYCNNNNVENKCVIVYGPNGKQTSLDNIEAGSNVSNTYFRQSNYTISTNKITRTASTFLQINSTTIAAHNQTAYNKIIRVDGWK